MSSVTLNLNIRASGKQAADQVDKVDGSLKRADKSTDRLNKSTAKLARTVGTMVGAYVGFAAVSRVIRTVVDNTIEQERATAQLNAALEATGGIAGRTADQLLANAAALQKVSTFGDEAIIDLQSKLLTFKGISGEVFDDTTEAVLDLATRMGGDLTGAVVQLGKAINDPVKNLSALSRVGIQFSDQQIETIKSLVETNRLMDAQKLILAELDSQFGGSARAARDTFGGALAGLRNAIGDLFEVDTGLPAAQQAIEDITAALSDPALLAKADDIFQAVIEAIPPLVAALGNMIEFIVENFDTISTVIKTAFAAAVFTAIIGRVGDLAKAIALLNTAALLNPFIAIPALMSAAAIAMISLRDDGAEPLTVGLLSMGDAAREASRAITEAFNSQEVAEVDSAIQAITAEIDALQTVLERSTTDKLILGGFGQDDEIRAQIELLVEDRRVLLERAEALDAMAESEQAASAVSASAVSIQAEATEQTKSQAEAVATAIGLLQSFGTEQEKLALIESDRVAQIQELIDNQDALADAGVDLQAAIAAVNVGAAEQVEAVTGANAAAQAWRDSIDALIKPLTNADETLLQLQLALEEATEAGDLDRINLIIAAMDELADRDLNVKIETDTQSIEAALQLSATLGQSLKDLGATEGEFQAITAVLNAVALAQGIIAILNQGQGDPFSAFGRIAAMIGIVAPLLANLGVSISGIGGIGDGGADGAAQQQQTQGTGTVLGDFEADSESILNALEITADATSELVGLNRGMLQALTSLNDSIGTASGSIARGATDIDFVEIDAPKLVENVTRAIGIAIGGLFLGPLGALLGNFVGKFIGKIIGGSSKVIDEGIAIAAGSINDAIDGVLFQAFQEVKVKKTFLSGGKLKTQTEALSDEFNNQLGLIFSAMIDSVLEAGLALGIDQAELQSRINAFEIEAQQISLMDLSAEEAQAELEAVFSAIFDDLAGFVVPFVDQFQQLGEGLAETLVRVATSVQVAEVAIERLGLQAERTGVEQFAQLAVGLVDAAGGIEEFISGFTSFFDTFASDEQKFAAVSRELGQAFDQLGVSVPGTREAMFDLIGTFDASTESGQQAIATLLSLTGAADEFFTLQEQMLDAEVDRLRKLSDIMREVLGIELSPLELINAQFDDLRNSAIDLGASQNQLLQIEFARSRAIAALQAELEASVASLTDQLFGNGSLDGAASSASTSISSLGSSIRDLSGIADSIRATIRNIQGSAATSNFDAIGRRDFLQDQFDAAIAAGDFGTANSIAGDLASAIREVGSSSSNADNRISDLLATLETAAQQAEQQRPPTATQVSGIQQSASQIEAQAFEQVRLATQLISELALLTDITGQTGLELAERFGIPLDQLVELIGIDLANLTSEQTGILGGLAEDFGLTIAELEAALNVSLGELSDATSLLNDGLEAAINGLPAEISGPLLTALAEAERTGNVGLLESLIADLAPGFRNELAPFFDNIDITTQADAQVNELMKISSGIGEMAVGLERIADNIAAQNSELGLPAFAGGGIATSASIFGEAGPEAAVPLPDGRSIPVTISGGVSSSATESILEKITQQNDRAAELLRRIESAVAKSGQDQTRELARSNRIKESVR